MVSSLVVVSTVAVQEKMECRTACSIVNCSFLNLVMDLLTKVDILAATGGAPPVPPIILVLCIVSFLIFQPSRGMQEKVESSEASTTFTNQLVTGMVWQMHHHWASECAAGHLLLSEIGA
jgi:hypothetical protein